MSVKVGVVTIPSLGDVATVEVPVEDVSTRSAVVSWLAVDELEVDDASFNSSACAVLANEVPPTIKVPIRTDAAPMEYLRIENFCLLSNFIILLLFFP